MYFGLCLVTKRPLLFRSHTPSLTVPHLLLPALTIPDHSLHLQSPDILYYPLQNIKLLPNNIEVDVLLQQLSGYTLVPP